MAVKKPAKKVAAKKSPGQVANERKAARKDTTPFKGSVPIKTKEKPVPADAMAMVEKLAKANAVTRKHAATFQQAKEVEDAIRADMLALFGKKKIDGMKHRLGTVALVRSEYAEVEDMEKVLKYAKLKGNADILTVGVSTKAVKARWDDGKEVPGVNKGKREDLRFTPAKKS